jgi:hypothetical protein
MSCVQSVAATQVWKEVPGHRGVFVDMASIVHIDVSGVPHKHCKLGDPTNSCHPPPADTTANIKVDGAINEGTQFWCDNPTGFEIGDWHFGKVGGEEHVIPTAATKLTVCGAPKR